MARIPPFPTLITQTRAAQGLSVREFAADLGVRPTTVTLWESGARSPWPGRVVVWIDDPPYFGGRSERAWVRQLGWRLFMGAVQAHGVLGDLLGVLGDSTPFEAGRGPHQRRALKMRRSSGAYQR